MHLLLFAAVAVAWVSTEYQTVYERAEVVPSQRAPLWISSVPAGTKVVPGDVVVNVLVTVVLP